MSVRCLMLCWEYPPIVEGGLGRHVAGLVPGLAAAGVEVHVLTRGTGRMEPEPEVDGAAVHRVVEPVRPDRLGRFVTWVGRLNDDMLAAGVRLVDAVDFDLVHGHDWLVGRAAERLAGRIGAPLVMTIHATEHGRHRGWVGQEPQSHIHEAERRAVHAADQVIACSSYMREHLADVFGVDERRISVIANGVRPPAGAVGPAGRAAARRAVNVRPEETVVLLAGRLVYEKGFQVALDALPGLRNRIGQVRYLIAGAGIEEGVLRARVDDLGVGEAVTFLGWVDPERLGDLFAIADLCLVPSIYEPFGLVGLEALAHGCPCVVADTGGLREIVGHGEVGLRFAHRDAGSLAAMVERMLTDVALRDRLVAAGRLHAAGFGWAGLAELTAGVYRRVCRTRKPAIVRTGQ